jgi:hypothetical protein
VNHPADIVYGKVGTPQENPDVHEYVKALAGTLKSVWANARQHLKRAAEIQQRAHAHQVIEWEFEIGDLVYKKL